nr:Chain C, Peptide 3 [synthetic construct]
RSPESVAFPMFQSHWYSG